MCSADESSDTSAQFESVSAKDSKNMFKPSVTTLVVSQSSQKGPNVMAAGWWTVGGYDPFRYVLVVNHHTYTYEIIEENPEFVLVAPTTDMVDALAFSGNVSGRDIDKIDHLGLETIPGDVIDVPLLADALGNVECRVMESFTFKGFTYYIAGVEKAHMQPGVRNGRILSADADPLANMGSDWDSDDDRYKHRYYIDFTDDNLQSYPEETILKTLPDSLQE